MARRWILALAAVAACIAALIIGVTSTGFSAANGLSLVAEAQPHEADAVQGLAERLLSPPGPLPDGRVQTTRLLLGQWPDGLPLDLPVPPGARLVGSSMRSADGAVIGVDGVLDASGAVPEILAFYARELGARGWTPASNSPPGLGRGGFQPASIPGSGQTFCKGQSGPWISVQVGSRTGAPNDVRVHVDPSMPGPCAFQMGPQPPGGSPSSDLLPPLIAPPGVAIQMQGSSTSQVRVTSEATANTDQLPADLESHFARQLQAAGWQRVAGGVDGPMAWSTWKVPRDGDWQGLLFVLDGPGQRRRGLYARVESAAQPDSVWTTGSLSIVPAVPGPNANRLSAPTPAAGR